MTIFLHDALASHVPSIRGARPSGWDTQIVLTPLEEVPLWRDVPRVRAILERARAAGWIHPEAASCLEYTNPGYAPLIASKPAFVNRARALDCISGRGEADAYLWLDAGIAHYIPSDAPPALGPVRSDAVESCITRGGVVITGRQHLDTYWGYTPAAAAGAPGGSVLAGVMLGPPAAWASLQAASDAAWEELLSADRVCNEQVLWSALIPNGRAPMLHPDLDVQPNSIVPGIGKCWIPLLYKVLHCDAFDAAAAAAAAAAAKITPSRAEPRTHTRSGGAPPLGRAQGREQTRRPPHTASAMDAEPPPPLPPHGVLGIVLCVDSEQGRARRALFEAQQRDADFALPMPCLFAYGPRAHEAGVTEWLGGHGDTHVEEARAAPQTRNVVGALRTFLASTAQLAVLMEDDVAWRRGTSRLLPRALAAWRAAFPHSHVLRLGYLPVRVAPTAADLWPQCVPCVPLRGGAFTVGLLSIAPNKVLGVQATALDRAAAAELLRVLDTPSYARSREVLAGEAPYCHPYHRWPVIVDHLANLPRLGGAAVVPPLALETLQTASTCATTDNDAAWREQRRVAPDADCGYWWRDVPRRLRVVAADYGGADVRGHVAASLAAAVAARRHWRLDVCNAALGGDPCPATPKTLTLELELDGVPLSCVAAEGQRVVDGAVLDADAT